MHYYEWIRTWKVQNLRQCTKQFLALQNIIYYGSRMTLSGQDKKNISIRGHGRIRIKLMIHTSLIIYIWICSQSRIRIRGDSVNGQKVLYKKAPMYWVIKSGMFNIKWYLKELIMWVMETYMWLSTIDYAVPCVMQATA